MEKLNEQIQEQLNSNLIVRVFYSPVMYQSAKHGAVPDTVGLYRQHLASINEVGAACLCFLNNNDPGCVRNSSTVPPPIGASWEPSAGFSAAHLVSSAAG